VKAAIYTRVSTVGQAQEGESLEMQKERLLAHINSQGWELFKVYEDAGISGGTSNRPAFQEMLRDAKARKFDILLVYKIDRLSRSILDFYETMQVLQASDISFVSLTQQFDTSTSGGRLMLAILVDFANFEREINVERSRDSYISRLYKGVHSGRTPFGYKREDGKLVVIPEQAETVNKAFDLALKGNSSIRISQELGLPIDLVKSILTNPVYTGFVCPRRDKHGHRVLDYSQWHKGQHDAIISLDTFKLVSEKRSRPTKGKHLALFSRLIYCPYCKHNLTAQKRKNLLQMHVNKPWRYLLRAEHQRERSGGNSALSHRQNI
jgi:site-specific DNA recombinase